MDIALWIVTAILALLMLMAGGMKLAKSKSDLADDPRMAWTEDFSQGTIRAIGALELAAAVGLILPGITGIAPELVPAAAIGVALLQIGAAIVHIRRSEGQAVVGNVVIIAMAAFIAWGRIGDYPL